MSKFLYNPTVGIDVSIFTLKSLCRDYYKFVDTRSTFKKKLSADLRVVFPGYNSVFSDITGTTSIAILKCYQTPQSIIDASNAAAIAISSLGLSVKITINIGTIENFNNQKSAA